MLVYDDIFDSWKFFGNDRFRLYGNRVVFFYVYNIFVMNIECFKFFFNKVVFVVYI